MRTVALRLAWIAVAVATALGCAAPASSSHFESSSAPSAAVERYVHRGGVELFVRSMGGGPRAVTLVALHGGPGFSHDYMEALDALASPRLRVVTFDQRGAGRSRTPADAPLGLPDHVADVEAVRAALEAPQIVLLGHSWGGLLAESYAVAHPDRVRALALVDPMPNRWDDLAPVLRQMEARRRQLVGAGVVPEKAPPPRGDDCAPERDADLPVDFADPRHPALRALATTRCSERAGKITFEALGHYDVGARLGALTMPVLIVYGAADASASLRSTLRSQLAAARVEEALLPACGHYPFLECPAAFFPRLVAFLEASGAR